MEVEEMVNELFDVMTEEDMITLALYCASYEVMKKKGSDCEPILKDIKALLDKYYVKYEDDLSWRVVRMNEYTVTIQSDEGTV